MLGAPRVLIVGALPPPSGGVATHCRELARALEWRGISVDLIDPRQHGPDGRDGRPRLLARLALARARRDIVHVHTNGHNPGSWRLASLCSVLATAPTLLTLHSGLAPDFVRSHNKMVRRVCNRYSRIIAVNDEIASALRDVGVDPERIAVAPAFTPSALAFRLAPAGLAQIRRLYQLLIACALAPGPEYGAMVMLDAFKIVHAHNNADRSPDSTAPTPASSLVAELIVQSHNKADERHGPRGIIVQSHNNGDEAARPRGVIVQSHNNGNEGGSRPRRVIVRSHNNGDEGGGPRGVIVQSHNNAGSRAADSPPGAAGHIGDTDPTSATGPTSASSLTSATAPFGAATPFGADGPIGASAPFGTMPTGLILYGPGTRDPAMAAAVRARGLEGVVHLMGELPRERALAVVAASDLFVRPTLADGDAISVREALALGRPVVASAVGARPAGARLFPAGDAAACAELLFSTVAQGLPDRTPPVDCLPALMAIYRRLGIEIDAVAVGTPLATVT